MSARSLACFLTLLLACTQGFAQSNQQRRVEARERFDRGLRLFDQHDDDGALAEFQRAYSLIPHPRVLYNIGLVRAALHQPVEAVAAFDLLLSAPGDLPPEQLAHAKSVRTEQAARIASLMVEVDIAGAQIEIDGLDVAKTPLGRALQLASGSHRVTVVARGYHPSRHNVSLAAGEPGNLSVTLVPLEGELGKVSIESPVPDAEVRVDGKLVAITPLAGPVTLAPGRREIELRRPGYKRVRRAIVVGNGASAQLSLKLEPDPLQAKHESGRVALQIREPDAVVFVDGVPSSSHVLTLPRGAHRLRVERSGFFPFERELAVAKGRTANVTVELEPTPEHRARYHESAATRRFWSWVAIGGGAIVAGGGIGFLVWNKQKRDDAQAAFDQEAPRWEKDGDCWKGLPTAVRATDCRDPNALVDDIDEKNGRFAIGWGVLAVGVAGLGVGTFLLATGDDPNRYEPRPESDIFGRLRLAPSVSSRDLGLGIQGSF